MKTITGTFIKIELLFILLSLLFGTNMITTQETGTTDHAPVSAALSTNLGTQHKPQLRPTFTATPVVIKVAQIDPKPTPTRTATPTRVPPTQVLPKLTSSPARATSANSNTAIPQAVVQLAANIRSGPGTNYNIVGGAKIATRLHIVGRNADASWLRICCVADGEKWIYAELILLDEEIAVEKIPIVASAAAVPTATTVLAQSPVASLPVPVSPKSIVTNRAANLRVGPDTGSNVIGIVEAQQPLTMIGQTQNGEWLLVCCDKGKDAWIHHTYVGQIPNSAPTPVYRTHESSIQFTDADSTVDQSPRRTCAYADDANHLQLSSGRVQQMPAGTEGEWVISGRRFLATNRTSLERERNLFFPDPKAQRSEFRLGDRVDVEYCSESGLDYALEIEIQP